MNDRIKKKSFSGRHVRDVSALIISSTYLDILKDSTNIDISKNNIKNNIKRVRHHLFINPRRSEDLSSYISSRYIIENLQNKLLREKNHRTGFLVRGYIEGVRDPLSDITHYNGLVKTPEETNVYV